MNITWAALHITQWQRRQNLKYPSIPRKWYWSFHHFFAIWCFTAMLPSLKKNYWTTFSVESHWPPPSKTVSTEFGPQLSLSPWSCLYGRHKMLWREEDTVHGTTAGLYSSTEVHWILGQTAQQSTWMVSGIQPRSEKIGISAQPKEMFSQWSDSTLSCYLCHWFLLIVSMTQTHKCCPYIHLSESEGMY